MELVTGVQIHFMKSEKFKTNEIKVRFSAPLSEETIAGRVLASRMIETANQLYPTSQQFREQLANLYGAKFFYFLFQNAVKCTTLILIYLMSVMLF